MTSQTIRLRRESSYGVDRIYVIDSAPAQALRSLTGKRTISYADIDALSVLGIEVDWVTS